MSQAPASAFQPRYKQQCQSSSPWANSNLRIAAGILTGVGRYQNGGSILFPALLKDLITMRLRLISVIRPMLRTVGIADLVVLIEPVASQARPFRLHAD